MKKSQHSKSFWSGKGFYVALALVIAGAATASFLAINSMMSELGTSPIPDGLEEGTTPWQELETSPAEEKQQGVPVTPGEPEKPAASSEPSSRTSTSSEPEKQASSSAPKSGSKAQDGPSSSSSQQAAASAPSVPESQPDVPDVSSEPPKPQYVSPHSGSILQAFSGDELVRNESMNDWRTHNGVDIAAKMGDKIKAPMAGAVTLVKEDPDWGGIVEITQGTLVARICGLSGITVKLGQNVDAGDILGKLGELGAESRLAEHVHVEFTENGKLVDPASYFSV